MSRRLAVLALAVLACVPERANEPEPSVPNEAQQEPLVVVPDPNFRFENFIKAQAGQLKDGASPYRFVAASEALMVRLASNATNVNDPNDTWVRYLHVTFALHARLGMRAIRVWADPELSAESIVEAGYGGGKTAAQLTAVYFERLDFILKLAEQYKLRVIMVLDHPWAAVPEESDTYHLQFLRRCRPDLIALKLQNGKMVKKTKPGTTWQFFSDAGCVENYRQTIGRVFDHANAHKSGLLYKMDKTILGWELMSEPVNDATTAAGQPEYIIRNWIYWMARATKEDVDPKQMLTVSILADDLPANQGLYSTVASLSLDGMFKASGPRTSMKEIAALESDESIDYLDVHLYTKDPVGIWADLEHWQGARLLRDVRQLAKSAGKPLVVSEWGSMTRTAGITKADAVLAGELNTYLSNAYCGNVSGMVFWHVVPPVPYPADLLSVDYNAIAIGAGDEVNSGKPAYQLAEYARYFRDHPAGDCVVP